MDRALMATGFGYDPEHRRRQGAMIAGCCPGSATSAGSVRPRWICVRWRPASVDAYFEEGVKAWDVAAGGLIAQEAGAQATRTSPIAGQPGLLVAGPALFEELVQALIEIRREIPQD